MKKIKIGVLLSSFFVFSFGVHAQGTEMATVEKDYSPDAFLGTQLINTQTSTCLRAKSWAFEVQHRFGKVGLDSTITQQFLGLDLPAVMRFAFGVSLSDRLYVKVGRTNHLKTYDIEAKYLIAKQTSDFKMPVSIAFYFNTAIRSEKFPAVSKNAYFEDDSTKFYYKPSHRLAYNSQFIISSRITDKFSLQINPTFIYQNLALPYTDNFTLVLSGGCRYKLGLSSALIFEYGYVFNNRGSKFYDPVSLGVEFGTVGHTFQLFVSSNPKILESHIYTTSSVNIADGEFLIGFNMQRSAWRKNKSK